MVDILNIDNHLFGGFLNSNGYRDKNISIKANKILQYLKIKYGEPLDYRRNRIVFESKTNVIKFPLNDNGNADNSYESMFIDKRHCKS